MKNKPTRHKETNTFKFKRFSERVSEIDVDVFHRVAHRYEEQSADDPETFFYQTLQKWNDLNLTAGYTAFKKEVRNIVTLPQLLNRKQEVIDILMRYLKAEDNKSYLQPILALIVAVARDLQKEFDEYFPDFLAAIKDLLQTKDAEQLELAFTTIAYLFKFLWRYLIRNVDRTFDLLLPLLGESKPAYVNNFAAESFAYVVRKVRDRDSFFRLVLQTLQEKGHAVNGCGRLMFEVISGTAGQFHSCAEPMLILYLKALEDETVDRKLAYRVLEKIFDCALDKIDPRKSDVLWTVLLGFIDRHTEARKSLGNKNDETVASFFRLVRRLVDDRDGRMLANPSPLVKKLVRSVEVFEDEEPILRSISDVAVSVILASSVKLSQEASSELVLKLMSIRQRDLSFRIVERLVDYSSFETLVLPHVIGQTIQENLDDAALDLFAKIVDSRSPAALNGVRANNWRKFSLDFRRASSATLDFLRRALERATREETVSENAIKVITILPHLSPLPEELFDALKASIVFTHEKLVDGNSTLDEDAGEKWNLLFLLAFDSAARILEADDFHDFVDSLNGDLSKLARKYPNSDSTLNAIDLILTRVSESKRRNDMISVETFDRMNDALAVKLSSPFHKTRLVVSHIYSLFRDVRGTRVSLENGGTNDALELMFLAESEPATVHKYRDRLVHLEALRFHSRALTNLEPKYHDFPLRYLMGNLWVNFSLLWDPVCRAIATYATEECPHFWPIFLTHLKAEIPMKNSSTNVLEASTSSPKLFECDVINSLVNELSGTDEKPDSVNHRLLLWRCMEEFVAYCETKNRDITGLFIDNAETNYFKSNTESARSWSILRIRDEISREERATIESDDDEEEEGAEERADGEPKKASKSSSRTILPRGGRKSASIKLILAQMKVFARMSNPRMLYRESEMNRIYMDLLTSKNVEIQRAALDCLFAYKPKRLLPYRDNLYSLVDEKNLKNELARFRIDQESGMLKDDDREGLMPVLMRLVYAKMVMKIGMRTGGKGGAAVRRKIILRFLAGCREPEMMIFTRMAFKPFEKFVSLDLDAPLVVLTDLVEDVASGIDLSNVIPPKRLRSAVNLLSVIIEQFGAKMMDNLLPRLLAVLVCVFAQANEILRRSENVLSGYLPIMKSLRTTCLGVLARFFAHFDEYRWKAAELDAVFDVAIFPLLERLPIEGIHSPTALLKLLAVWAENPRYYKLLIKHRTGDPTLTPLPYVMKLLLAPKSHGSVVNAILEMVEKMLTLRDNDKTETDERPPVEPLPVANVLGVNEDATGGMNHGSLILMPHVSDILRYAKTKLERSARGINGAELTILSRLSELVKDPETSDELLSLLLPILAKRTLRGENEETMIELLATIVNLAKNVRRPEIHLRAVLPLLATVSHVSARKLLLRLIDAMARGTSAPESRETFVKNSKLLLRLNAWDEKWIEQPNFEMRLDAFGEIAASVGTIEEERSIGLSLEFGVAFLYTCYFFLSHETDLSLRDSAGQCLKTLGPRLARACQADNADRRYLMDETILRLVKNGVRSKSDVARNQSIAFLGEMSLECPDVHPVLRDLSLLANRHDREVDFFENLQHLQLHRRARALLKFCSLAKSLKRLPNTRTLTQFVLPLASYYLCNESYANKNSIVDAAIETVGTICRLLPWHHYEIILKHYLDKLGGSVEFQRQIVRILVSVLDAFHYDLSKLKSVDARTANERDEEIDKSETMEIDEAVKETIVESVEAEERLDVALDAIDDDAEKSKDGESEGTPEVSVIERRTILSRYAAKRLVFGITQILLPKLHRSIVSRTHHENSHKVNRRRTGAEREEEELGRVPIALAMVKLLQKLPEGVLDSNLPGIFMKLCTFLKSRLDSVRRATREILQKIMTTLGPDYLHHLLREMNALLTKGFQIHVLAYTIHAVLVSLKPHFEERHVSENLRSVLSVCKIDLFGTTGEEKDITAIGRNVSEARTTKSYDIYAIIGRYVTESCLLDVVLPLREILAETRSHGTVRKAVECLRHFVLGLADNTFVPVERLVVFIYGIVSESIPELLPATRARLTEKGSSAPTRRKFDCFVIAPVPKTRTGVKAVARVSADTNAHVTMEFALKLFHILLKRERVAGASFESYLDPFVPILAKCLDAKQVKLSTLSLQCLNWILKMDLPTVRESVADVCSSIFEILHKYAAAGLSKGDNFDLVMASFKCMSVLVRDVKHFSMTNDQTRALVLYAEQDLHDGDRQATAFNLLKAIISRKIIVTEMHAVMEKVATLSVTSDLDHVRQQSRSVFYSFLMEYPLGKRLDKHIAFYLSQLSYDMKPGRLSALEMIHSIVTGFPVDVLEKQSGILFFMVGARLINDEDPSCRKLSAKCIKETVQRVSHNQRVKLFDIVKLWLKDSKITHRTLAAQLCGIFVNVEKDSFETRLTEVLPLVLKQFHAVDTENASDEPGRFVKLPKAKSKPKRQSDLTNVDIKDPERMKDHHLFQVLQLSLKIAANCSALFKSEKYEDSVRSLAEYSQSLLAHPHLWVRLAATQLIGFVLASLKEEKISRLLEDPEGAASEKGYLYSEPVETLRSLSLDLVAQLQPDMEFEELADQVVKNLVFLARVTRSVGIENSYEKNDASHGRNVDISILWLLRRLRKCVNVEVTQAPKSTSVRTAVFKWIAGIIATIPMEHLRPVLFQTMSPLVRELATTDETNAPLRHLAKEVAAMMKKRLGNDDYARLLAKVQQKLDARRNERKNTRTQQQVTDPELAAKRKIARQQKKKEAKKRRMTVARGKRAPKKPRREVDLEL